MQKINPIIIIPSRLGAMRLPNKPLALINGKTMIEQVYQRGLEADLGPVYVATPDLKIKDLIEHIDGKVVMTSPDHPTGSDRIFEAVNKIDPQKKFNVVINLQGDLPLIAPKSLQNVLQPLQQNEKVDIATIASPIKDLTEKTNPNVVKIALELEEKEPTLGRALYFSRSLIPVPHDDKDIFYHHIGVYAFRREALERFMTLPTSLLEKRERLEQLRALAAGMRIDVAIVDQIPSSVDTEEDLEKVRRQAS